MKVLAEFMGFANRPVEGEKEGRELAAVFTRRMMNGGEVTDQWHASFNEEQLQEQLEKIDLSSLDNDVAEKALEEMRDIKVQGLESDYQEIRYASNLEIEGGRILGEAYPQKSNPFPSFGGGHGVDSVNIPRQMGQRVSRDTDPGELPIPKGYGGKGDIFERIKEEACEPDELIF